MKARRLTARDFRNLRDVTVPLEDGVNILYGENAQGKTNFLEGLWLFTGGRSFRGARDAEMVAFGAESAALTLNFFAAEREQTAAVTVDRRRTVTLNGVKLPSPARLAGRFCGVVFSPAHLSLIKDGPEGRRRFVDAALCQIRPGYLKDFSVYARTLHQRNALLKEGLAAGVAVPDAILDVWDERLARAGAAVFEARRRYWRQLAPLAAEIYAGLSASREELSVAYRSRAGDDDATTEQAAGRLLEGLRERRAADGVVGYTTGGVHRDDLEVAIDGKPARIYGSQGQQRSAVLALKLAEAALLRQETGEAPVMLLDDVMSELDLSRQDYILNHIHGWQVVITCCDPAPIRRLTAGAAFEVAGGTIERRE
ncbi:MAG: DNA replication/repair protein RecF [Acutalibacteraceae bacterium]|jgi:DNA replication and repair protein RecF